MDWLCRSHRAVKKRHDRLSHGRPHSKRESSLEQGVESCKVRQRAKENAKCRAHRKGKPRKKGPRPARERKGGEAKGRPSHIGLTILSRKAGLTNNLSWYIVRNARFAQVRSSKNKQLFVSGWCKFEHRFSHPFPAIQNAEDL